MKHLLSLLILLTVLVSCEEQEEVTPVEVENVGSPVVTEEDGAETPPTP